MCYANERKMPRIILNIRHEIFFESYGITSICSFLLRPDPACPPLLCTVFMLLVKSLNCKDFQCDITQCRISLCAISFFSIYLRYKARVNLRLLREFLIYSWNFVFFLFFIFFFCCLLLFSFKAITV